MSELIHLTIDGVSCTAEKGQTVLSAAEQAGIEIPTLCYMKDIAPYGACGMCVVEAEGIPKLLRACSATVSEGMVIHTRSDRVDKVRRIALELLMSDHDGDCVGPCSLQCPAHTDCQKYIKEIADGDMNAAVRTIREKIPLPASIGRVCPHPCETACRRQNVESPLSIAYLKAFAADEVRNNNTDTLPEKADDTGKTVGIIGGGPAGLTAAYRLALAGHKVTVYDKMPKMGGMLRYGIPEYRLPKFVLDDEISFIAKLGVEMKNNVTLGKDITLSAIREKHDAVLLANGAWKSMSIRCKGEDAEGVFGGIDFLRAVALGQKPAIGKKCAVVGGGNTAMDACRTAVRLGAEEVTVIYRRTRAEMPAEDVEIEESIEEGVQYAFLTNPDEILTENGKVTGVRLQVMELGEPDERGRRSPVPVAGKFIEKELDSIIIAAGQKNDSFGFEDVTTTSKGTIAVDEHFYTTDTEGVFAAGDAVNKGAGIAVAAIGQANEAALAIDAYLNGYSFEYHKPVVSERKVTKEMFADREKQARIRMPQRPADERKHDFREVNLGFSYDDVVREAKRCLECGCHDYHDCRLIRYANEYNTDCHSFTGAFHPGFVENRLEVIERNERKCIRCNLCVRVCEEQASGLLGLVGRGFTTVIKPEFRDSALIDGCKDCMKCVNACPTGALRNLKG